MASEKITRSLRYLAYYYALLQLSHLIFLTRAGSIYYSSGQMVFPAQPPAGGWSVETIPYLLGMGAVDALAAGLALYAGWVLRFRNIFLMKIWVISLTVALTSAVIFCFGTIPSGAWWINPIGYGLLGLFFAPLFLYYVSLLRFLFRPEPEKH